MNRMHEVARELALPAMAMIVLMAAPLPAIAQPPSAKPSPSPVAKPSPKATASPIAPPASGAPHTLPNVTLRDRTGRKVALSKYLGKKPILLYLYNVPAERTAADLQNLQAQMDNQGLQAIAIHGDRSRRERAQQQFLTVAIAYPVLLDSGTVAAFYGVTSDPTAILIGPDGIEVKRWTGFDSVDKLSGDLKAAIQTLPTPPQPPR